MYTQKKCFNCGKGIPRKQDRSKAYYLITPTMDKLLYSCGCALNKKFQMCTHGCDCYNHFSEGKVGIVKKVQEYPSSGENCGRCITCIEENKTPKEVGTKEVPLREVKGIRIHKVSDCIPDFKGRKYSHKTIGKGNNIFIGLENEICSGISDDMFSENVQRGSDCTVCNDVELRQRPFTDVEYFMDRSIVKEITRYTNNRKKECTCSGMHVHLDRSKISLLTTYKIMVFFQFNDRMISSITRRYPGEYNHSMGDSQINKKGKISTSKYTRVHTHSQGTLEFRAFAEALRPKHTYQNIEFCLALVDYCNSTSLKEYWKFDSFTNFVQKHKHIYKYLYKHMRKLEAAGFPVAVASR